MISVACVFYHRKNLAAIYLDYSLFYDWDKIKVQGTNIISEVKVAYGMSTCGGKSSHCCLCKDFKFCNSVSNG